MRAAGPVPAAMRAAPAESGGQVTVSNQARDCQRRVLLVSAAFLASSHRPDQADPRLDETAAAGTSLPLPFWEGEFLVSDYIWNNELPAIRERHKTATTVLVLEGPALRPVIRGSEFRCDRDHELGKTVLDRSPDLGLIDVVVVMAIHVPHAHNCSPRYFGMAAV